MSNFAEIMQQLRHENAIIELSESSTNSSSATQLATEVTKLLQQPEQQKIIGKKALKVVLENQGASEKTLAQVQKLLGESS